MRETKREWMPLYSYFDRSGISRHLEDMAAKGWLLEKLGPYRWLYRRIEPKRLRFAVTFFPAASQFDPGPSEELERFRDFCEAAGWVLAADSAQVQVFYNENENAVPIETDPATEFANIHRSMKRGFLISYWILLAMSLYQLGFHLWRLWNDPVDVLSSSLSLSSSLAFAPLLLVIVVELIRYYRWRGRAREAAAAGRPLPELRSARWLSVLLLGLVALELLFLLGSALLNSRRAAISLLIGAVYVVLLMLLVYLATTGMKKLRFSARANRAVTIVLAIVLSFGMMAGLVALVFRLSGAGLMSDSAPVERYEYGNMTWEVYADPLPLTIQDLLETDYDGWSTRLTRNASPLLTHLEATQRPRMDALDQPDLAYEIVIVRASFLYGLCRDSYIRWVERWNDEILPEFWDEYRPVDMPAWDAETVYQLYSAGEPRNQFLVCWPDRMAEISFDYDWEITPELAEKAAERLKGAR